MALAFGIFGVAAHSRVGTILMTLASALAFLIVAIAFTIDMILFNIIRSRIRADAPGNSAQLADATWLTLGALVALALGACAAGCGSFGRYRYPRRSERIEGGRQLLMLGAFHLISFRCVTEHSLSDDGHSFT